MGQWVFDFHCQSDSGWLEVLVAMAGIFVSWGVLTEWCVVVMDCGQARIGIAVLIRHYIDLHKGHRDKHDG